MWGRSGCDIHHPPDHQGDSADLAGQACLPFPPHRPTCVPPEAAHSVKEDSQPRQRRTRLWSRYTSSCTPLLESPRMLSKKRLRFNPWVRQIPWRRKWQPTPVFLPGKSHGQRSLAGHSPGVAKSQTRFRDSTATAIKRFLKVTKRRRKKKCAQVIADYTPHSTPCPFHLTEGLRICSRAVQCREFYCLEVHSFL